MARLSRTTSEALHRSFEGSRLSLDLDSGHRAVCHDHAPIEGGWDHIQSHFNVDVRIELAACDGSLDDRRPRSATRLSQPLQCDNEFAFASGFCINIRQYPAHEPMTEGAPHRQQISFEFFDETASRGNISELQTKLFYRV